MKLKITNNKSQNIDNFVYSYLPLYIYKTFLETVDINRLAQFDKAYNINSFKILTYLLKHLLITKVGMNDYTISLDKKLKVDGKSLEVYSRLITYGTRTIKGYPIINDIFKMVAQNIDIIYDKYKRGG